MFVCFCEYFPPSLFFCFPFSFFFPLFAFVFFPPFLQPPFYSSLFFDNLLFSICDRASLLFSLYHSLIYLYPL